MDFGVHVKKSRTWNRERPPSINQFLRVRKVRGIALILKPSPPTGERTDRTIVLVETPSWLRTLYPGELSRALNAFPLQTRRPETRGIDRL